MSEPLLSCFVASYSAYGKQCIIWFFHNEQKLDLTTLSLVISVANIYDVSGRLYLLKLSRANRKEHLLIESGIRLHTTQYIKNQKDLPSGFSMKLRKHLRTKKVENIAQLGMDRVVDLTFGRGEAAYHILVELYASGNVILTDHTYTILSLLRSHKFEENARIAVK